MYLKHLSRVLVALTFAIVTGCVTPNAIILKTYPPISETEVEVLFQAPDSPNEIIASISAYARGYGSLSRNTKKAIEKLKSEAAKIGGNAIVLQGPVKQSTAMYGNFGGSGFGVAGGAGDATVEATVLRYK